MSHRRYAFKPGTQSVKQTKRNLRHKARHIIDSKNYHTIAVGDRVIRSVAQEPDPEFSALHLICAGLDAESETGEPWVTCMTHIMDEYDAIGQASSQAT